MHYCFALCTLILNISNVPYITLYQDNIYAVGGNDGISSLDKCEKYDPLLNKWTFIAPMNRHRAGAGVAELDGYLYVVGKEFREKKVHVYVKTRKNNPTDLIFNSK